MWNDFSQLPGFPDEEQAIDENPAPEANLHRDRAIAVPAVDTSTCHH
jgi:hypothetical protein